MRDSDVLKRKEYYENQQEWAAESLDGRFILYRERSKVWRGNHERQHVIFTYRLGCKEYNGYLDNLTKSEALDIISGKVVPNRWRKCGVVDVEYVYTHEWIPFHFGVTTRWGGSLKVTPEITLVLYRCDETRWNLQSNHPDYRLDTSLQIDPERDLKDVQREALELFRRLIRERQEQVTSILATLDKFLE